MKRDVKFVLVPKEERNHICCRCFNPTSKYKVIVCIDDKIVRTYEACSLCVLKVAQDKSNG